MRSCEHSSAFVQCWRHMPTWPASWPRVERKYDAQFKAVFDAIRQLMQPPANNARPEMGFHTLNEGKQRKKTAENRAGETKAMRASAGRNPRGRRSSRTRCPVPDTLRIVLAKPDPGGAATLKAKSHNTFRVGSPVYRPNARNDTSSPQYHCPAGFRGFQQPDPGTILDIQKPHPVNPVNPVRLLPSPPHRRNRRSPSTPTPANIREPPPSPPF